MIRQLNVRIDVSGTIVCDDEGRPDQDLKDWLVERIQAGDYEERDKYLDEPVNFDPEGEEDELDESRRLEAVEEGCPSCGTRPGQGLTEGCEDEFGCGYWRAGRPAP